MEKISESEAEKLFDEILDETYPAYTIGDIMLYPSDILKSCDRIAYDQAMFDYLDNNDLEIE